VNGSVVDVRTSTFTALPLALRHASRELWKRYSSVDVLNDTMLARYSAAAADGNSQANWTDETRGGTARQATPLKVHASAWCRRRIHSRLRCDRWRQCLEVGVDIGDLRAVMMANVPLA